MAVQKEKIVVYRGEIYYANLSPSQGSEQGGCRPVVILQNNTGNRHSPTTIIAPLTTKFGKKLLPTHIELMEGCGAPADSLVLLEQIRTIDKTRLSNKLGVVPPEIMAKIDEAIKISLGVG